LIAHKEVTASLCVKCLTDENGYADWNEKNR